MNRSEYEKWVEQTYGEIGANPFGDDRSVIVYRHSENKKWFAVTMTVPKSKLGIREEGKIDIVNVKCAQEIIDSMWRQKGIYPAYHMNKAHWLSLALDGSADDGDIEFLTEISHSLTKTKIIKRKSSRKK